MAADTTILQGEIFEDPKVEKLNVEALLTALLRALLQEQTTESQVRS